MNVCNVCGMKFIRNDYYEKHLKAVHGSEKEVSEDEKKEAPVEEAPVEAVAEEVKPETEAESNKIILKFREPVEVTINGHRYAGTNVEVPNISLASEIVRIAREAYGSNVLE